MSGINHLLGKGNKEARVDGMPTDSVNSIVERISGVNPTKLVEGAQGAPSQPAPMDESLSSAVAGAPVQGSPLQQTMGRQAPAAPGALPKEALARMNYLQEQIEQLQQKVTYYEGDHNNPDRASNHGIKSTVYGRDMDLKKKKKKDPADGKTNAEAEAEAQSGQQEQTMSNDTLREIGLDNLQEWRSLAGLPASMPVDLTGDSQYMAEDIEDVVIGDDDAPELSEEELGEIWVEFLGAKDLTVEEFEAFVDEVFESGNSDDQEMVLALEDEFYAVLEAMGIQAGEPEPEQEQSSVDVPTWEEFLGENDITIEQFMALMDEAIAEGDEEMMDSLIALEDMYGEAAQKASDHPRWDPDRKTIRGGGTRTIPLRGGSKPSGKKVFTPADVARGKAEKAKLRNLAQQGREYTGAKESIDRRMHVAKLAEMEFDADADPDGSPRIPWGRILKSYKVKMAASDPQVQAGEEGSEEQEEERVRTKAKTRELRYRGTARTAKKLGVKSARRTRDDDHGWDSWDMDRQDDEPKMGKSPKSSRRVRRASRKEIDRPLKSYSSKEIFRGWERGRLAGEVARKREAIQKKRKEKSEGGFGGMSRRGV